MVTTTALSTPMLVNQESLVLLEQENKGEDSSSNEGVTREEIVLGDYVHLSSKDTLCMSKLFGSETKVCKCHLNLLLLELFKVLGQKKQQHPLTLSTKLAT
jgi:hypothetical protein